MSESIQEKLFLAISSGNVEGVRQIGASNQELISDGWNGTGASANLILCIQERRLDVLRLLLEMGVDVNATSEVTGDPPVLFFAAANGDTEAVDFLLENGAFVDGKPDDPATPLMAAAARGNMEIVKRLLESGADINREHLQLPETALDAAIAYQFQNTGQDAVVALLREHGGVRPYTEVHDWTGVPGQRYIEHIERAVGAIVNPLMVGECPLPSGEVLAIRKVRIPISPAKFDFQLLFTVGLVTTGFELALCLPSAWPLNESALKEDRFAWPIHFINKLGEAVSEGMRFAHGDLIDSGHPALAGVAIPDSVKKWVVSFNQQIEKEREEDCLIPRTLILSPCTSKKSIKPGAEALALADKREQAKWKALAVAL